jgi:signal transduction histidine kinase
MVRHGIRFRISVAFFSIGAVLSSVFAVAIWYLAETMERSYVEATLLENLDMVIADHRQGGGASLPYSKAIKGYSFIKNGGESVPAYLADLGPGIHERAQDGVELQIAVRDEGDTRFALVYDGTSLEILETDLVVGLIFGVGVFSYAALWLGFWASGRVVEPITDLANRIRTLGNRMDNVALDGEWGDDEVGELARAFERYSKRLREFIERETEFTADVSHELRNPIMSASSTIELLLARRELGPSARPQLLRIQRAVARMADLVDVFLTLAREGKTPGPTDAIAADVEEVVNEVLDRQSDLAAKKGLRIDLDVRRNLVVHGRSALTIVLENLVENAIRHTFSGRVGIVLDENSVTVTDSGPGIPVGEMPRIFDRAFRGNSAGPGGTGLGLSIVRRLCERAGWSVEISTGKGGGTVARVTFPQSSQSDPTQAPLRSAGPN